MTRKRHNSRWTDQEVLMVVEAMTSDASLSALARKLGRTSQAVYNICRHLRTGKRAIPVTANVSSGRLARQTARYGLVPLRYIGIYDNLEDMNAAIARRGGLQAGVVPVRLLAVKTMVTVAEES